MPVAIWNVDFNSIGIGFDGTTYWGSLSLHGDAGPDLVRVDWGDAYGGPQSQFFHPDVNDGSFAMPSMDDSRVYEDGSYTIRVIGMFGGGGRSVEVLSAFFNLNDLVGANHMGSGKDDLMNGGLGDDTFIGGNGKDWLFGGYGNDLLIGGNDDDFLGGGGGDAGADTLIGGGGNDLLAGDGGDDKLYGNTGTDYMYGGEGNDTLFGQEDNDYMNGESGDDSLNGGIGDDTLRGGDGNDAVAGADTLAGGDGNDELDGGAGNDLLRGDAGDDSLTGGDGADTLIAGDGVDQFLFGDNGDDKLFAGNGFERMNGGAGNDTLVMTSDGGLDFVVFDAANDGLDRVSGFEHGIDKILFFGVGNPDSLHFVNSAAEMTDNSTYVIYNTTTGRLMVDMNGRDAGGLQSIAVFGGAPAISYDDFIFPALA